VIQRISAQQRAELRTGSSSFGSDNSDHASVDAPDHASVDAPDLASVDAPAFCADIEKLKAEFEGTANHDDFRHLKKIERFGRLFSILGFATAWIIPNPLSAFFIQMGIATRFLLLHMISHGGYDGIPGIPKRYTSKHFALGWRRYVDCFEWWPAETWHRQHNELHHYYTGEGTDPDTLERHGRFFRDLKAPKSIKRLFIFLFGVTWKYTVYAPNSMSVFDPKTKAAIKPEDIKYLTFKSIFKFRNRSVRELWTSSYLPYVGFHFVLIPLLFVPIGWTAVLFVFLNRLLAEFMTNLHGALVIFANHAGDDLYSLKFHYRNKEEFYVTQVVSSTNYRTGTEFVDYMSMWLNYQIEHHLFPRLPMLKYRQIQPRVKAICEKHGVPYRQESIFKRGRRAFEFLDGKTDLPELWTLERPDSSPASPPTR
jgi:fatty acid desaturase